MLRPRIEKLKEKIIDSGFFFNIVMKNSIKNKEQEKQIRNCSKTLPMNISFLWVPEKQHE